MTTTIYGIENCAYYSDGHTSWYATRGQRNRAIYALRVRAEADGLSPTAAESGIIAVRSTLRRELRASGESTITVLDSRVQPEGRREIHCADVL